MTPGEPFVIGQHYGGGIIFWIDEFRGAWPRPAESDQGFNWWGDRHYFITGATGTAVGAGFANLRKGIGARDVATRMQRFCTNYRGGGFADWLLPSKDELFCFIKQKDVVGGFVAAPTGIRLRSTALLPGPSSSTMTMRSSIIRIALTGWVRFGHFSYYRKRMPETVSPVRRERRIRADAISIQSSL